MLPPSTESGMLQSLISLEDQDIDTVLDAVTAWCDIRGVLVDSAEGRRAITIAVDIVCNHGSFDLYKELSQRLDEPRNDAA